MHIIIMGTYDNTQRFLQDVADKEFRESEGECLDPQQYLLSFLRWLGYIPGTKEEDERLRQESEFEQERFIG